MRSSTLLAPALLSGWLPTTLAEENNPPTKRGLAHTPNDNWPDDDKIWSDAATSPQKILSWYYNFGWEPSESYASIPQSEFEFVPMMWGAGTVNGTDSYFAGNISSIIDKGRKISHVMTFTHPDVSSSDGGAGMKPRVAARSWVNNAVPLQEKGVKVGLPIVGDPYNWVGPFLANCSEILAGKDDKQKPTKRDGGDRDEAPASSPGGASNAGSEAGEKNPACKVDFIPITSYGNMTVLKERIGMFASALPGIPIWLIEYGYNDQDLETTQAFFNESLKYLEETEVVERYAWFGAARSIVLNVGPNAAMLNPYGDLTDIGSWYLGGNATGVEAVPTDKPGETACTPENPCGANPKNGAAGVRRDIGLVVSLLAVGAAFSLFL